MPIGLAGDSPQITTTTTTQTLSSQPITDLLSRLLVELRANTQVINTGLNLPDELDKIRIDEDRVVDTSQDI